MSFYGLDIAISALRAQQYAMDVTAHNIANAGTEGYRRQTPVFAPGETAGGAFTAGVVGAPQVGTGVVIQMIRRAQTEYVDSQTRQQNQWLGSWSSRSDALQQVESILTEPGEHGLSSALDRFWNSWEDLASSPESLPARISIVENGIALSGRIRRLYSDMRQLQARTDGAVVDDVSEVNRIVHEIARINEQIRGSEGGDRPNDLLDRRDLLIEQLSKLSRIEVSGIGGQGLDLIISISGKPLVQGAHVTELATTDGPGGWSKVVWSDDSSDVQIVGGDLSGQLFVRDNLIEGYIQTLNGIAQALVNRVNAVHSTGTDLAGNPAGDFFVPGTDAASIAVSPSLVSTPSGVAGSATGAVGDNTLALTIAGIRDEVLIGGETIGGAYGSLVSLIGSQSREATNRADVHNVSLQQLRTQRDSVAGVSLDEEMTNMVKFQQAYNAAARVLTAMDEMIDTLVNRMGT